MVQSSAKTVSEYLKSLPQDRRAVMAKVRATIRAELHSGFVETMGYGMIVYCVPLKRYPVTYNGQPLAFAALAAQKRYYSVYLPCYHDAALMASFRSGFEKAGKKLDMGKCCVRFRKIEDLALDEIGKVIASVSVDQFIEQHERARASGQC